MLDIVKSWTKRSLVKQPGGSRNRGVDGRNRGIRGLGWSPPGCRIDDVTEREVVPEATVTAAVSSVGETKMVVTGLPPISICAPVINPDPNPEN